MNIKQKKEVMLFRWEFYINKKKKLIMNSNEEKHCHIKRFVANKMKDNS
jgi:hypothetical protein